jgi:glycosyltransferase involved in cell wall biosynthesis
MISVVIPCYNRGKLVARAIESAVAQGRYVSQVIVVDDGSTDDTRTVCASYGEQIESIWQKNAGPSIARNTGLMHARNRWVAFLDSDDYWTTSHLARMAEALEQTGGEARFYFSDMQFGEANANATLWKTIDFTPPRPVQLVKDGTNWAFLNRQPFMLQCSVFCREAWLASGGLDPKFRLKHDSELFYRLSIGGKICAVSGVGCVRTDDDATSVRLTTAVHPTRAAYWHEAMAVRKSLLHHFPSLPKTYFSVLRFGLAFCRWKLVRAYWASKQLAKAGWHLAILAFAHPAFLLSLLIHRSSRPGQPTVTVEYD